MAHDPLTASPTLCLAGPAGHGKSLLVRRLHEDPGDALSGKLGTTTSRLRTPRRQWLAIDARHESELLREIVGGGIEAPVALVVVDVRNPAATAVGASLAFLRLLGLRDAVVAVNRGRAEGRVTVDAPAAWAGGAREAVTGDAVLVEGGRLEVVVPPRQARVYVAR